MKNVDDIRELKKFGNLEFLARTVVEGFITGLHKSPFHGFSVEFAEHRAYNPGESVKHIDWNLYAKTDKLYIKNYEEETNLRSRIILDISSSMLYPYKDANVMSKLAFSVYCAGALIHLFRKQRDAVGLSFISDTLELHTPAKMSGVHTKYLYSSLETLLNKNSEQLNKQTDNGSVLRYLSDNLHKRSLIIIFSDMLSGENSEQLFSSLRQMTYNKHEVILFHVSDPKHELDFNFKNRPIKFIDMETSEQIKLNPNQVRDIFTSKAKEHFNNLKIRCSEYNIDFVKADVNSDFKEILIPYLLKRKMLY